MAKRIEFFYDIGSPYSYLAATQIEAVAARAGGAVEWRPFLLGGVFKATGNTSSAGLALKARYMFADLTRWAQQYGVPFQMPSRFPLNTLRPMRACIFGSQRGLCGELALALYRGYWVDDVDITGDDGLRAAARSAGLDAGAVLAACEEPAVKDALRSATEEAVRRGAFGAPTFFVGDEMFWGNDRLHFVEAALRRP